MKKYLFLLSALFLLGGCSFSITNDNSEIKEEGLNDNELVGKVEDLFKDVQIGMTLDEVKKTLKDDFKKVTTYDFEGGSELSFVTDLGEEQYQTNAIILKNGKVERISERILVKESSVEQIVNEVEKENTEKHGKYSLYRDSYLETELGNGYEQEYLWNINNENKMVQIIVSLPVDGYVTINHDYAQIEQVTE